MSSSSPSSSSSLPVTPIQYHKSPFIQSPIVTTTRSHSIKRNKLRQSSYTRWSLEEDDLLKKAVALHGPHKWSLIASHVPNRTPMQCSTRWLGALNPNIHKGRWTEYEDNILKYSVLEYANVKDSQGRVQPIPWNRIAERIPNRTGIQCQARWTEALDPYVRKGKWGVDEDHLLRTGVKEHGRCWIRIAEMIPGRTQRQCRTRWMQLQCKNNKQASSTSTSPSPSIITSQQQKMDLIPFSSPHSSIDDDVVSPSSTEDEPILSNDLSSSSNTPILIDDHHHHHQSLSSSSTTTASSFTQLPQHQHQYMTPKPDNYFTMDEFDTTHLLSQQQLPPLSTPSSSTSSTNSSTTNHHHQQNNNQNSHNMMMMKQLQHQQHHHHQQQQHFYPIQTTSSPSDVYTYFNQLSHQTNVFPQQ
ncbi:Homeodomain-like protein [Cunninghamella echinulata]|nr:Homeodomain-like protein [Cunninghamella echinulata]